MYHIRELHSRLSFCESSVDLDLIFTVMGIITEKPMGGTCFGLINHTSNRDANHSDFCGIKNDFQG